MTDVPPPDSPKPPRGRPRRPKGFDDVPVLSDEEVARRVDVRGGGAPRAPIERAPVRDRRPPVRQERTVARDSMLLIGLVIVGLVAVRLFLPDGPLTATATAAPAGSEAAVASGGPTSEPSADSTGGLVTLPPPPPTEFVPTASPAATAGPVTQPPAPTPTLKPGQTPQPTPKPTKTPTPTATPSSPPGTATVVVKMHIINDNGGDNGASDWTMKVTGEVGSGVSPNNFPGSEAGTTVTITAGLGYLVNDNIAVSGYGAPSASDGCKRDAGSGGLAAGQSVECVITRNDQPARVNVTITIVGADPPDFPVLAINAAGASDTTVSSSGTTAVTIDSNSSWSVTHDSGASGYGVDSSGTCSSGGLNEGQSVSCTFTFTEPAPASPASSVLWLPLASVPLVPALLRRRPTARRWRSNPAG